MADEVIHKSFDPTFFALLFEVEDRHFWFRSRNRIIAALVKRLTAELRTGFRVLEVGCGTGNVLRVLDQACPNGTVVGMDLFAEGLKYARGRTTTALVQGDMHQPPFTNQFDIIGLFDVLEHLPDDGQVLCDLQAMLRENGVLLLTVPAHPGLWSYFDEASRHCRRYQPDELKQKLIETGYDIEYSTQYMMSIFPLVWIGRRLSSLRRGDSRPQGDGSAEQLATQELRLVPIINALACVWPHITSGRVVVSGREKT
jgi:2-polyprenyl-3-methyl-5-hydroxy-6-metoxy-1,4-benzoquinol methylase